jgi:hypothetical protein
LLLLPVPPGLAETWESQKTSNFYFHYQPEDQRIARQIYEKSEKILQQITADVGQKPQRKIAVYLCPTLECFQQQQPSKIKAPEWAVGLAYPQINRIVMRSTLTVQEGGRIKPLEIFQHELAHIVLEQALAEVGGAPRWLSEGFSMYYARQWTSSGQRTIEEAALKDNFIPLSLLTTNFPIDEQAARLAYAQSFSVVSFLLNEYGQKLFHQFIRNLKKGMDTDTALRASVGISLKRLELEWQALLKKRHSWFSYLSNVGLFWFVLSVIFLLVYLIKRQKVKRIQQRWEQEEFDEIWHERDIS